MTRQRALASESVTVRSKVVGTGERRYVYVGATEFRAGTRVLRGTSKYSLVRGLAHSNATLASSAMV